MPAPRHLRHPAPHPPHRHTTRIPSLLLPSIRYPLTTLYRIDILDRYICTSHHLLPYVLTLLSAALSTLPHSVPPLFRTHSPRPQHLTAILLHSSPPLSRVPSEPPSAEKFALPRLKQAVTHLWKSFILKEAEDLSSTSYPDDTVWITL